MGNACRYIPYCCCCRCCCERGDGYSLLASPESNDEADPRILFRSSLASSRPLREEILGNVKETVFKFLSEAFKGECRAFKRSSDVTFESNLDPISGDWEVLTEMWTDEYIKVALQEAVVTLWYHKPHLQDLCSWKNILESLDLTTHQTYEEVLKHILLKTFKQKGWSHLNESREIICSAIIKGRRCKEEILLLQSISWDAELAEILYEETVRIIWYTYPVLQGFHNIMKITRATLSDSPMTIEEMMLKHYFETYFCSLARPVLKKNFDHFRAYLVAEPLDKQHQPNDYCETWKPVIQKWNFALREVLYQEVVFCLWNIHPVLQPCIHLLEDSKWYFRGNDIDKNTLEM